MAPPPTTTVLLLGLAGGGGVWCLCHWARAMFRQLLILSICQEPNDAICMANYRGWARYATLHNITFLQLLRHLDVHAQTGWTKVVTLRLLLEKFEYVFWVDHDTLPRDMLWDVREELPRLKGKLIRTSEDKVGAGARLLITAVKEAAHHLIGGACGRLMMRRPW